MQTNFGTTETVVAKIAKPSVYNKLNTRTYLGESAVVDLYFMYSLRNSAYMRIHIFSTSSYTNVYIDDEYNTNDISVKFTEDSNYLYVKAKVISDNVPGGICFTENKVNTCLAPNNFIEGSENPVNVQNNHIGNVNNSYTDSASGCFLTYEFIGNLVYVSGGCKIESGSKMTFGSIQAIPPAPKNSFVVQGVSTTASDTYEKVTPLFITIDSETYSKFEISAYLGHVDPDNIYTFNTCYAYR